MRQGCGDSRAERKLPPKSQLPQTPASCIQTHIVDKCYYVCGRLGCASHCLYGFAAIVSHRMWHPHRFINVVFKRIGDRGQGFGGHDRQNRIRTRCLFKILSMKHENVRNATWSLAGALPHRMTDACTDTCIGSSVERSQSCF